MSARRIVVIGASAGGVRALQELVAELPGDFPAPILVVLHMPPQRKSLLPQILTSAGPLTATEASDGEPVQNGHIYVAAPITISSLPLGPSRCGAVPRKTTAVPLLTFFSDPLRRAMAQGR